MRRLVLLGLTAGLFATCVHAGDVVEYYHLDAIGNVRAVTNQAGQVIERHDYLPSGEEWCGTAVCGSGTPGNQPKRFTGKERDPETGLDYFGARYYGSRIGRFTTVDPVINLRGNLLDPQRWNRYAYGRNNPFRYIDPDGRDIMVIENGSTQGNPFGHSAIAVSGAGIYSFGNETAAGSSPTEYLLTQATRRDSEVFILKTSPEQDAAALKYLQSFSDTSIGPSDSGASRATLAVAYAACVENCATRTNAALDAAGIPPLATSPASPNGRPDPGAGLPVGTGVPGTAGTRATAQGAVKIGIPKGSTSIPAAVKAFEPRREQEKK